MSGGQTLWCVDYTINKTMCQEILSFMRNCLDSNLFKSLFKGFYFDVSIKPNSERRDKNEPKLQLFLLSCDRCCSDSFAISCVTHSLEIVRHYYCEQCVMTGLGIMIISSVTRCLGLRTSTPDEDCATTNAHSWPVNWAFIGQLQMLVCLATMYVGQILMWPVAGARVCACVRVQCASYIISLLSKMWFVWVNRHIITLLKPMWNALLLSCNHCNRIPCLTPLSQGEVWVECNILTLPGCLSQPHHFAMSLPSVLTSLPPPSLASPPCDRSATVTGTILSVSQTSQSTFYSWLLTGPAGKYQSSCLSVSYKTYETRDSEEIATCAKLPPRSRGNHLRFHFSWTPPPPPFPRTSE